MKILLQFREHVVQHCRNTTELTEAQKVACNAFMAFMQCSESVQSLFRFAVAHRVCGVDEIVRRTSARRKYHQWRLGNFLPDNIDDSSYGSDIFNRSAAKFHDDHSASLLMMVCSCITYTLVLDIDCDRPPLW